VSPKNVVVAGRVAVSADELDVGAGADEPAGACARAAVENARQAATMVEVRIVIVIKAVPPAVPAKAQPLWYG